MSYRVYISDHAARDLHAIYEHITFHLQAPLNARKQLSRLEDAIYSLDISPSAIHDTRKVPGATAIFMFFRSTTMCSFISSIPRKKR